MIVQAFACGLSKTALLQFGASNTNMPLYFDNYPEYPEAHHTLSHEGGERFKTIQQAIVQEFANILTEFAKTPADQGRSILDAGIFYLASGLGDRPNYHNGDNIPCVLVGGAGGRLRGGQMVDRGGSYNEILSSIARLQDPSIEGFGNRSLTKHVDDLILA